MKGHADCNTRKIQSTPISQEKLYVEKRRYLQTRKTNENKNGRRQNRNSHEKFRPRISSGEKSTPEYTANQNKTIQTNCRSFPQSLKVQTPIFPPRAFKMVLLLILLSTTVSANSILHRLPSKSNDADGLPQTSPSYSHFIVHLRKRSLEGVQCYVPLKNLALLASYAVTIARNGHTFRENAPRLPPKRNILFLPKNDWPIFALEMHQRLKNIYCEIEVKPRVLRREEGHLIKTLLAMINKLQEEMNKLGMKNYNSDLTCPSHTPRSHSKRGVMTELNRLNKVLNDLCVQGFRY